MPFEFSKNVLMECLRGSEDLWHKRPPRVRIELSDEARRCGRPKNTLINARQCRRVKDYERLPSKCDVAWCECRPTQARRTGVEPARMRGLASCSS